MPPKKHIMSTSNQIKQKKYVYKRLMEISLKLDEYIYKGKVISVDDAEMCLNEVISFKTYCYGDARSLQVIEKLTRHLKFILAEKTPNVILISHSVTLPNTSNYSIDKIIANTSLETPTIETQYRKYTTINDGEVNKNYFNPDKICLSQVTNTMNAHETNINISLENLSLQDQLENKKSTINNNIVNSEVRSPTTIKENNQLLLSHNNNPIAISDMRKDKDNIIDLDPKESIEMSRDSQKEIKMTPSGETVNIRNPKSESSLVECNIRPTLNENCLEFNKPGNTQCTNFEDNRPSNYLDDNIAECSQSILTNYNKANHEQLERLRYPVTKQLTPMKNTIEKAFDNCKNKNDSNTTSKRKVTRKRKDIIADDKKTTKEPLRSVKKTVKKTNSNRTLKTKQHTENDLVWIENVKYVREICPTEYDVRMKNLTDSFWENVTSPYCNENDFMN